MEVKLTLQLRVRVRKLHLRMKLITRPRFTSAAFPRFDGKEI